MALYGFLHGVHLLLLVAKPRQIRHFVFAFLEWWELGQQVGSLS